MIFGNLLRGYFDILMSQKSLTEKKLFQSFARIVICPKQGSIPHGLNYEIPCKQLWPKNMRESLREQRIGDTANNIFKPS